MAGPGAINFVHLTWIQSDSFLLLLSLVTPSEALALRPSPLAGRYVPGVLARSFQLPGWTLSAMWCKGRVPDRSEVRGLIPDALSSWRVSNIEYLSRARFSLPRDVRGPANRRRRVVHRAKANELADLCQSIGYCVFQARIIDGSGDNFWHHGRSAMTDRKTGTWKGTSLVSFVEEAIQRCSRSIGLDYEQRHTTVTTSIQFRSCDAMVSLLASQARFSGFSHANGFAGFLGDLPFLPPCIPAPLHTHLASSSSTIDTSILRVAQISPPNTNTPFASFYRLFTFSTGSAVVWSRRSCSGSLLPALTSRDFTNFLLQDPALSRFFYFFLCAHRSDSSRACCSFDITSSLEVWLPSNISRWKSTEFVTLLPTVGWTHVRSPRPRSRCEGAIRATLTRTPSASSLVRAWRAVFPSPGGAAPGFLHVVIVPDNAAGQRVFSVISRLSRPHIPALLHTSLHFTIIGSQDLENNGTANICAGQLVPSIDELANYLERSLSPTGQMEGGEDAEVGERKEGGEDCLGHYLSSSSRPPPIAAARNCHYTTRLSFVCMRQKDILEVELKHDFRKAGSNGVLNTTSRGYSGSVIDESCDDVSKTRACAGTRSLYQGLRKDENPPTSGVVRNDSHVRKSGRDPAGNRNRFALVGGDESDHYKPPKTHTHTLSLTLSLSLSVIQWRVVKCCKVSWRLLSAEHTRSTQQESATKVGPGESECIAATHKRASRHPIHTCCDV
ncbi:hypothetical protein PR048_007967 [Dryococelus australis]|uniref:Uncharacterized protein n=1 Tax=Dryococelus australis TaxID=614101 RepID=A0ABQ9HVS2_9NEOP|nr:hypothetical protein PR048_007967 [Dryococelus australis]